MNLTPGQTLGLQCPLSLSVTQCIQPFHPDTGRALYRVKDNHSGLSYALKQYDPALNPEDKIRHEMQALNRIPHPSPFPHVYFIFRHAGMICLLMEWLEGTSLRNAFGHPPRDINEVRFRIQVLAAAASTLGVLHEKKLVHRDIKPDNLLLVNPRDVSKGVLLIDFGNINQTRALTEGTPGFQAPEQAGRRDMNLNIPADLFALGQTGWWLLTGQVRDAWPLPDWSDWDPPLPALRDSCPEAPEALASILERCMSFDPRGRYPNAGTLAHELRKIKC